ncbi:Alpha/Beta hydrolase protein [Stachybotrys elegans]|uniref:Alpha/Beta hydrolase protein n=1 Tax=Stachybotrys elegans TaxID=80388 RepID=A0A8K0WUK8_9HYPO|nr:Alpha/Beta hydrolase protein [Stachybotrys elegans]
MFDFAVVICHGSYHTPVPYEPLINALKSKGIDAYCPQLPTADLAKLNVGDIASPDFDLGPPGKGYPQGEEDTDTILRVIQPLINQGKKVMLIGHSSGGWVASQSARSELCYEARKGKGQDGGIIGILFVGGFIIPVGESVNSFFQPQDGSPPVTPPFMRFHKHGWRGLGTIVEPEKFLFNDLDQATAQKYVKTLTASPILTTKLTTDAYSNVTCGYLVLDGDLTLPQPYQEGMIALQQSKQSSPIHVYHCPAGHSPHLSLTEGLADTIRDFAIKTQV